MRYVTFTRQPGKFLGRNVQLVVLGVGVCVCFSDKEAFAVRLLVKGSL